jgi:hypothetical protein
MLGARPSILPPRTLNDEGTSQSIGTSGFVSRVLYLRLTPNFSRNPSAKRGSNHLSGTTIARRLKQPTRESIETDSLSSLFGLAPSGVYQATRVTSSAGVLLPHRFTLTTHRPKGRSFGGLLSVALSLTSRPVGVTDHSVLRCPDFPPSPTQPCGQAN